MAYIYDHLSRFILSRNFIETTSAIKFSPQEYYGETNNLNPVGGTFYLRDNKLNFCHISGYIETNIIDLTKANEKLYPNETFVRISKISNTYYNNEKKQTVSLGDMFDLYLVTCFNTEVVFRIKCELPIPPLSSNGEITETLKFSFVDYYFTGNDGDLKTPYRFTNNTTFNGISISNKSPQIRVDGNIVVENDKAKPKPSVVELRNRIKEIGSEAILDDIKNYFTQHAENIKYAGWGGLGGYDVIKTDDGRVIAKRSQGKSLEAQAHNTFLDVGYFAGGTPYSLYLKMPIKLSQISNTSRDENGNKIREVISDINNINEVYRKSVLEGGDYAIEPPINIDECIHTPSTRGFMWVEKAGTINTQEAETSGE